MIEATAPNQKAARADAKALPFCEGLRSLTQEERGVKAIKAAIRQHLHPQYLNLVHERVPHRCMMRRNTLSEPLGHRFLHHIPLTFMERFVGRPPKQPIDRRQPTTLRLDPEARVKLERYAADSGRSLGKEIEARIAAMNELDALGVDLVSRLGAAISALTRRNKGKRWHVDLTGWAAVAELLTEGPIQDFRPTAEPDADQQWESIEPLLDIDQQREGLVAQLAALGFSVDPERKLRGLLRLDNRSQERAAMNNAPEGELRSSAIHLHTRLMELDEEYERASERYREAMKPYAEAEEAGRQICRDYLRSEAQSKRDAGEDYNPNHLTRTLSEWR